MFFARLVPFRSSLTIDVFLFLWQFRQRWSETKRGRASKEHPFFAPTLERLRSINPQWFSLARSTISKEKMKALWTGHFRSITEPCSISPGKAPCCFKLTLTQSTVVWPWIQTFVWISVTNLGVHASLMKCDIRGVTAPLIYGYLTPNPQNCNISKRVLRKQTGHKKRQKSYTEQTNIGWNFHESLKIKQFFLFVNW